MDNNTWKLSDNLTIPSPLRKIPLLFSGDGGGFTLLNFAYGEPCKAGIQEGKGGGDQTHGA